MDSDAFIKWNNNFYSSLSIIKNSFYYCLSYNTLFRILILIIMVLFSPLISNYGNLSIKVIFKFPTLHMSNTNICLLYHNILPNFFNFYINYTYISCLHSFIIKTDSPKLFDFMSSTVLLAIHFFVFLLLLLL